MALVSRMEDFIHFAQLRQQGVAPDRIFQQLVAPKLQEIRELHARQIKEASGELCSLADEVQSIKIRTISEKITSLESTLGELSAIATELNDKETWEKIDQIIKDSLILSQQLQKHLSHLATNLRRPGAH